MPTIDEMSYGYNQNNVSDYISRLQAIVLDEAASAVTDLTEIRTACEANWEGKARQDFLDNVALAAKHVADRYIDLFNALNTEITNVQASMSNFDNNLIQ